MEDERERIVNEFNLNDQRRGIKWKYSRRPFWSIRNKQVIDCLVILFIELSFSYELVSFLTNLYVNILVIRYHRS